MRPKNVLPDHGELSDLSLHVARLGRFSQMTAEFNTGMTLNHRLNLAWVKNWIIEYMAEEERSLFAIDCLFTALSGPIERRNIDEIQDALPDLAMVVYLIKEAELWVEMMRERESGEVTRLNRWRRWKSLWGGE